MKNKVKKSIDLICANCGKNANPECVKTTTVWKDSDTSWSAYEKFCDSAENRVEGLWGKSKEYDWSNVEEYYRWKKEQGQYQDFHFTHYCKPCYNKITAPPKWDLTKLKKESVWKYTNNQPLIDMTKAKLKKRIVKDIDLLNEILPIEIGVLDSEDINTWDEDACGDLISDIDKVKEIVESENGLNAKLLEWQCYQENCEDEES